MIRAVLDANILVSGIARYAAGGSAPVLVLLAAVDRRYHLLLSEAILKEAKVALSKTYFGNRLNEQYVADMLVKVRKTATETEPMAGMDGVATHWQDDLVLATALSGQADYLVTGDRELLELDHPYLFRIVHPGEFLAILEKEIVDER